MQMRPQLAALTLLLLAGSCDRQPPARRFAAMRAEAASAPMAAAPAGRPWFRAAPAQGPGMHLAYAHAVGLEIGGGVLAAHFAAARDRCLTTPALHCLLLRADLNTPVAVPAEDAAVSPPPPPAQSASLQLRLPHDQVAAYANALTDALPGERAGLVRVVHQSTTAEDLGRPLADVGQRVAQLQDYLASLKALGGRLTISVSDLVKIAGETAQAQTQIEQAQAEQRDLALRVDTELLDVDFQERAAPAVTPDPVQAVRDDALAILRANVAEALRVAIGALPWVPVAGVGLLVLWVVRVLVFGRRRRSRVPT